MNHIIIELMIVLVCCSIPALIKAQGISLSTNNTIQAGILRKNVANFDTVVYFKVDTAIWWTSYNRFNTMDSSYNNTNITDSSGIAWFNRFGVLRRIKKREMQWNQNQLRGFSDTMNNVWSVMSGKQPSGSYLTSETDPVWTSDKPSYLTTASAASTYQPILGFTPVTNSRTITINGTSQDLSSNRTWNVGTLTGNDTTSLSNRINAKYNTPLGTTAQYVRGDGSLATFPAVGSGTVTQFNYTNSTGITGNVTNATTTPTLSLTIDSGAISSFSSKVMSVWRSTVTYNNNVARSLNNNYTISTTRPAQVNYAINISYSVLGLVTFSGTAFLEYSTNGGSSWITVNQCSRSGTVTVNASGADDLNLTGMIAPNALVRIRTTASNCTVSYQNGQEILY